MIKFLTLSEVLIIIEDQVRNYGGLYVVSILDSLSSTICAPQSSFDEQYLYNTKRLLMCFIFVKTIHLLTEINARHWQVL
jgi:hypothetical protein